MQVFFASHANVTLTTRNYAYERVVQNLNFLHLLILIHNKWTLGLHDGSLYYRSQKLTDILHSLGKQQVLLVRLTLYYEYD